MPSDGLSSQIDDEIYSPSSNMAVVGWICVLKWSYLFGTAQISSDTRRPHRFKPKGHIWAANTSGEPLRAPVRVWAMTTLPSN